MTTVIPAYNEAKFIVNALNSLASQLRPPDRVIVVDDCSTDNTCEVVRNYDKIPCELIVNERNLGAYSNLNRVLEFAKETEYFHILCPDDALKPTFIRDTLSILEGDPTFSTAWCKYDLINEQGKIIKVMGDERSSFTMLSRKQFLRQVCEILPMNLIGLMIRSNYNPLPCRFHMDEFPAWGDHVFNAEWSEHAPVIRMTNQALVFCRSHAGSYGASMSLDVNRTITDEWRAMKYMADMIPENSTFRFIRRQKLKCLFAVRSTIKWKEIQDTCPSNANRMMATTKKLIPLPHFWAGRMALWLYSFWKQPHFPHPAVNRRSK